MPLVEATELIPSVQRDLEADRITANRKYYEQALSIAVTILQGRSIQVSAHGRMEMASYIINFETLFEDYLRNVLSLRAEGTDFRVLDGNSTGARPLFDDLAAPLAQPDIVVRLGNQMPIIIDVKYKDKPDRADINQVVTYSASYRTNVTLLAHQSSGRGDSGLNAVGTIGPLKVLAYGFDLSANLEDQEKKFAETIFGLAKGISPANQLAGLAQSG